MAGDWIKMREALHEDPAVLAIANALATRPEHVVGYCHKFWSWVSRNCRNGVVEGVTIESVECVLNLPGFLSMMVQVGWLGYDQSGQRPIITIPNFDRHLSEGAKNRALRTEQKRSERSKTVAILSHNNGDKTATREEKRREENTSPSPPPGSDVDPGWEEVEGDLFSLGVSEASAAISAAASAGCHAVAVRRVISHYRSKPDAWGPGALFQRVRNLRPDQDPSELWPPPAKSAVAADNSADRERVAAEHERKRREATKLLEADDDRKRRLEDEHGGEVNGMTEDDIRRILETLHPKGWGKTYGVIPDRGIHTEGRLRDALLNYLDVSTTQVPK